MSSMRFRVNLLFIVARMSKISLLEIGTNPVTFNHTLMSNLIYNQFHNILRLFNVLLNSPFTTSETMGDYYLQTWYIRVASRVAEYFKTFDPIPQGPPRGSAPTRKKKDLGSQEIREHQEIAQTP